MVKTDLQGESEMKLEPTPTPVQEKQISVEKDGLVLRDQILHKLSYLESHNYSPLDSSNVEPTNPKKTQQKQSPIQNHKNSYLKPASVSPEPLIKSDLSQLGKLDKKFSPEMTLANLKHMQLQQKISNPQINPQLLQLMNPSFTPQSNLNHSLSQLQSNLFPMNHQNHLQSLLWNLNPQDLLMMESYSNLQNLNFMYADNRHNQHSTVAASQYPFNHLQNNFSSAVNNGYLHQMSSLQALGKLIPQLHEKQKENMKSQPHQYN
jgi:hypothetical protein